jgi:predicted dehydrogenase
VAVSPLRAAVVGTGRIAVQHLGCLARLPVADTVAVCDVSPARAEAAAARWGVPRWYVDHRRLLAEQSPDVVHVTTPPTGHLPLALDALASGAHVIVEKPAAPDLAGVARLLAAAQAADRHVVESYTYVFSEQAQRLLGMAGGGDLGEVVHVDASIALAILERGSPFADLHVRHPSLALPGGAVSDFLTHLASLAQAFAGPHRSAVTVWRRLVDGSIDTEDELRALVLGRDATATLSFSASSRPEGFWLRVEGTRLRAVANLFETRLTIERVRTWPRPVATAVNGLIESRDTARAAVGGALRKLSGGPGSYEGLWTIIKRTYAALACGGDPPVSADEILAVNRLVTDLTEQGCRL